MNKYQSATIQIVLLFACIGGFSAAVFVAIA